MLVTFLVLLYGLRVLSDPYPYKWNIDGINLTCELGYPGWTQAGISCFFPFHTKNQTWYDANQMCRNNVFSHSYGTRLQNWLIARSLLNLLPRGLYWTGLRGSKNPDELEIGWNFVETSIYNPIWASDEPPHGEYKGKCVALDLLSERSIGWRMFSCDELLPVLCETFACLENEFRCEDNSRCIPKSAVGDDILDCGDGSDERKRALVAVQSSNLPLPIRKSCGLTLTSRNGWIISPNYPKNYSERTFCNWEIIAPPEQVIILNVMEIIMSAGDNLLVEEDEMKTSLADGSAPFSYISKSNAVKIKFSSGITGTAKGFSMRYQMKKKKYVCPFEAGNAIYQSWVQDFDCEYLFSCSEENAYTILQITQIARSKDAMVTLTYDNSISNLKNTAVPEILILPANKVRVTVRNAWLSKQHTIVHIGGQCLQEKRLEFPGKYDGVIVKWLPSINHISTAHILILIFDRANSTDFKARTLIIDSLRLSNDTLNGRHQKRRNPGLEATLAQPPSQWQPPIQIIEEDSVINIDSPIVYRTEHLQNQLHFVISQFSSSLNFEARFSKDCPPIDAPPGVSFSLTAGNQLGSFAIFQCSNTLLSLHGSWRMECLTGGKWSSAPPICLETKTICSLPVIQNGFVISVSPTSSADSLYGPGTRLLYGCNFGYIVGEHLSVCRNAEWTPSPKCTVGTCMDPEDFYNDAKLLRLTNKPCIALTRALYVEPSWSMATHPYRVCYSTTSHHYEWSDFNFNFKAPCSYYPVNYGFFEKQLYSDGEEGSIVCSEGFEIKQQPRCNEGKWSFYDAACTDINECSDGTHVCDPDATCENHPGGYTCLCPPGKILYMDQGNLDSRYLISGLSCVWKTCAYQDLTQGKGWISVNRKDHYRHGETATFLCNTSDTLFLEFKAKCMFGSWELPRSPCLETCPKTLRNKDLISGVGQTAIFNRMQVRCKNPNQIMIGSGEIVCGHGGHWLSEPICRDLHCPTLDDIIEESLEIYRSDSTDLTVVGNTLHFKCRRGRLEGSAAITCNRDGAFGAVWSAQPPTCKISAELSSTFVNSGITYEEWTISGPPYMWTHSPDWRRFNSTWIGFDWNLANSFLISPAIPLKSSSLKIVVHIQRLIGSLSIGTYSSSSSHPPPSGNFTIVAKATIPGFVDVPLKGSGKFLRILIQKTAATTIQSVKFVYTQCQETSINGIRLGQSYTFSKPRQITAKCDSDSNITNVTAICKPLTGWWVQEPHLCCSQCSLLKKNRDIVCTHEDCANGRCFVEGGVKKCDCFSGFRLLNGTCVPETCKHIFCAGTGQGKCIEKNGFGECQCGFGFKSNLFCTRDSGSCPTCVAPRICLPILSEHSDAVRHQCVCLGGSAEKCSPDPCMNNSCGQHGKCIANNRTLLGYSCECEEGWIGQECRTKTVVKGCIAKGRRYSECGFLKSEIVDRCANVTCFRGTCEPTEEGYSCRCDQGYEGVHCEKKMSKCKYWNPCQQGNCLDEGDNFYCNCSKGWEGKFCENQLNLCNMTSPCLNKGLCRGEFPGLALCQCMDGYRGDKCETNIQYCEMNPCFNNGTCEELFDNGYKCHCRDGFIGENCETSNNVCDDWRCENEGTCYLSGNFRPLCLCKTGFTGEHCENQLLDPCSNYECKNNGTCVMKNNEPICNCPSGYGGIHCEEEWKECEEFPDPLQCLNNGNCVVINHQQHCECSIDFFGTNCEIFGRSCAVISCNSGTCFNDTNLQGHCICPPEYTGEFCETLKTSSYNLFFNGLPSSQKIVSRDFPSTFLREFTLCGWVFYAPDQQVAANVELAAYLQLNTTLGAPILSLDNTGVTINGNFHINIPMSLMAWHHVCVRSPKYPYSSHPLWTIFLDGVFAANVSYAELSVNAEIRCRVQLSPRKENRFRGEISLVQLYIAYINDVDVAKMAFQCRDWISLNHLDLLITWTDFTTIQRNNPGVMTLYPGLCYVSDCLPGRSNCNTKDKIPPLVKSCPRDIRIVSSERLTKIEWDTNDMFVDNIGIVSVESNYRSGQAFTWGYHRVVYVGSDAAGNLAFCSFSVVVSPTECQAPKPDAQLQGSTTFVKVNGTDTILKAQIECSDKYFPRAGPEFYVCDVMGQWDRSSFWPTNRTYSFPSCGMTTYPVQNISGTLQDYGNCTTIRQRLLDSLLNDLQPYCGNCTEEILINPVCHPKTIGRDYRSIRDELLNFNFYVNINSTRDLLKNTIDNSLQKEFPNSTLSTNEELRCDVKFPHLSKSEKIASCADCPAGHYWDVDQCVECPVDTYRARTDPLEKCNKCPEKTTTAGLIGQKDKDACHEICDAGEYYDEWLKKCSPCPLGTYQEKRGSTSCMPCASDTTTTITGAKNASDCSFKCGAGQELGAHGACIPCARGTYWVSTKQFTGCVECPRGLTTASTKSTNIRDCAVINCPVGTRVNTNRSSSIDATTTPFSSLCITCVAGTYQDQSNQTMCKPCTSQSYCDLVNGCSPLLADSCPEGETCEKTDAGVYSCSSVTVKPAPTGNEWILWIVIPVVILLVMVPVGVVLWLYRNAIYTMMCCTKLGLKNMESTNYYRNSTSPILPRRRDDHENVEYRNYPPRNQTEPASPINPFRRQLSLRESMRRLRDLPPPIITSRAELDLLEEQARKQSIIMGVIPTPSKNMGSVLATGYSPESPGPSISAQIVASGPRVTAEAEPLPALPKLAEDGSNSSSFHWTESSLSGDASNALGEDDDEDYFG